MARFGEAAARATDVLDGDLNYCFDLTISILRRALAIPYDWRIDGLGTH